jgi:hypothetical protein
MSNPAKEICSDFEPLDLIEAATKSLERAMDEGFLCGNPRFCESWPARIELKTEPGPAAAGWCGTQQGSLRTKRRGF